MLMQSHMRPEGAANGKKKKKRAINDFFFHNENIVYRKQLRTLSPNSESDCIFPRGPPLVFGVCESNGATPATPFSGSPKSTFLAHAFKCFFFIHVNENKSTPCKIFFYSSSELEFTTSVSESESGAGQLSTGPD